MTAQAKKSTRFPIRLPWRRPSLPFKRGRIAFSDGQTFAAPEECLQCRCSYTWPRRTGRCLETMTEGILNRTHLKELVLCHSITQRAFLFALLYIGGGLNNFAKLIGDGIVFASHHTAVHRDARSNWGGGRSRMIKIIHSGWAYSSESLRRFRSESDIFIKVVYTSDGVNNCLSWWMVFISWSASMYDTG